MIQIENFKNPGNAYKVDVRWWLAEGLHTDETLKHDLDLLKDSGFGAVEFLAMDEPGADSKIYGWGSEEWVHDSTLMFEETTKRNMGVSATCGTNWANCNLTSITPDDKAAAKELDYAVETVKAGQTRNGKMLESRLYIPGVTKQEFIAAVAIRDLGIRDGKHYLDKDSAIVLNDSVKDGELTFTAPADGDYLLFFFWIHGTGQTAKPSASISYTVNYMDRYGIEAFKKYWDAEVINPKLRETLKANGRAMMYMDSLELCTFGRGGQLWGYDYIKEFKARRGYDITPYLPFVLKQNGMMQQIFIYHYFMEDKLVEEKLYNDLYQTTTDMYIENMMKPMQEWCHDNYMSLRSEISYGLPFEISLPGKYVDGVETESLEFASQIEAYRGLAGTAHVYNRIYSSETGATMLNYMMPLDFYTQIMYTQFAAGVTRTVLHGYSSIAGSEDSTYWPGHEGMWPIFSERFGVRQPAFRHYNDWTGAMSRYQMLLRSGKPRMDLAILRLDYNFNNLYFNHFCDERELYEHRLMRGHEGVYWKDMTLQDNGYTWDYFAPQILEEDFVDVKDGLLLPDGPGYQAVIVFQNVMPIASAKKLLALAKKGLPVLFVNGCTETIRPNLDRTYNKAAEMTPFRDGKDAELAEIIREMKALANVKEIDDQSQTMAALRTLGVKPRTAFTKPNRNILTLTRKDGDRVLFYAYNMLYTEKEPFTFTVDINGLGKVYRIDCWNAEIEEVGLYQTIGEATRLTITLNPGQACLYIVNAAEAPELHAVETDVCAIDGENGALSAKAFKNGDFRVALSDGTEKQIHAQVPAPTDLKVWDLTVEDWNEGKKVELIEDRGLGIVTKEVYYETKKDKIPAGKVELKPWKDIPAIGPDVSGVGYYTTTFALPENWNASLGAVLKIENTQGNTLAVYVNDQKAGCVDFDVRMVDITPWIHSGENTITVEVSTTLNNRLKARGYYDEVVGRISRMVASEANNSALAERDEEKPKQEEGHAEFDVSTTVHDYGMTGKVQVLYYQKLAL